MALASGPQSAIWREDSACPAQVLPCPAHACSSASSCRLASEPSSCSIRTAAAQLRLRNALPSTTTACSCICSTHQNSMMLSACWPPNDGMTVETEAHLLQLGPHERLLQPGCLRMQAQERRRVPGAHSMVRRCRKARLRAALQAARQPPQHACNVQALWPPCTAPQGWKWELNTAFSLPR